MKQARFRVRTCERKACGKRFATTRGYHTPGSRICDDCIAEKPVRSAVKRKMCEKCGEFHVIPSQRLCIECRKRMDAYRTRLAATRAAKPPKRGRRRFWTAEDDSALRKLWPDTKAAIEALGRTREGIRRRAIKLGLIGVRRLLGPAPAAATRLELWRAYATGGTTGSDIARALNISRNAAIGRMKRVRDAVLAGHIGNQADRLLAERRKEIDTPAIQRLARLGRPGSRSRRRSPQAPAGSSSTCRPSD